MFSVIRNIDMLQTVIRVKFCCELKKRKDMSNIEKRKDITLQESRFRNTYYLKWKWQCVISVS